MTERTFSILNMRTTPTEGHPPADLNTPAKIRRAAIEHFARDGFQKAGLRAIAASAGVSAGLVIHHFGSKSGLRAACDENVLGGLIERGRHEATTAGLQDVLRDFLADPAEFQVQIDYLARAISEDSPTARRFVDTLVDETEAMIRAGITDGTMRPSTDPRVLAAVMTMNSLATLTMSAHLARALGYEAAGPELMRRLALPSLELYTHGLYTDDSFLQVARDTLADSPPRAPTPSTPSARTERTRT